MAMKASIIAGIEFKVGPSMSYSLWKIGLTNNPEERRKHLRVAEVQNVDRWAEWPANSMSDAEDIELYFLEKGMNGNPTRDLSRYKAAYVYIY